MSSKPTVIWVQNLPSNWSEEDLKRIFGQFGEIESVERPRLPDGKLKPFGFVHFQSKEAADAAIGDKAMLVVEGQTLYLRHKLSSKGHRQMESDARSARQPPPHRDDRSRGFRDDRPRPRDCRDSDDRYREPPRRRDDYYDAPRRRRDDYYDRPRDNYADRRTFERARDPSPARAAEPAAGTERSRYSPQPEARNPR